MIDAGGYPVIVAEGWAGLGAHVDRPAILVTDDHVGPRWAAVVAAELPHGVRATFSFPAGEASKTVDTWRRCVEALIAGGIDRDTPILALGGGVVGDLAGFAAATALRGVPWLALPTTLLAMVDASIGGKTAVNLPAGKNLVGAFHPPRAVWAATRALDTLPPRELACGWAEVLKTALVGDAALLDEWTALDHRAVVERCARVKAAIVRADPFERGARVALNLGHTVGHGIETASDGAVAHGEAVAIGLVAEARFAARRGICVDPGLPARIADLAREKGLPTEIPSLDPARLLAAMQVDKKGTGDKIRLPLPERAGRVIAVEIPRAALPDLLGGS